MANDFIPAEEIMKDDMLRDYFSMQPKKVDPNSAAFSYYCRTLFRKAMSIYEFDGIPEGWDLDYMISKLLARGFITITDTEVGVIPLECGISGINVFNHPTTVILANPVLGNFSRTIGEDCALVKISYDYRGILDIIYRYAYMLAECDC